MDKDGNKQLSLHELAEGLHGSNFQISNDEIKKIFDELDTDGSGSIDLTEFITALRVSFIQNFLSIFFLNFIIKLSKQIVYL